MATFSKEILSGSTDGKGILVAATATAGTLIHTGSSTASTLDEIWIYAQNTSVSTCKLTLEWGGVSAPSDHIEVNVVGESGLLLVASGLLIKGNASSALIVRAFAAVTNVITIHGFVNRITA
jgi:hypothetical protein